MKKLKKLKTNILPTNQFSIFIAIFIFINTLTTSCLLKNPTNPTSGGFSRNANRTGGLKYTTNDPSTVETGYGRILQSNPIILTGNPNLSDGIDLSTLLLPGQDFITYSPTLESSCGPISMNFQQNKCLKFLKSSASTPLLSQDGKWAFEANGEEFLQVHTFAHTYKTIVNFQDALLFAYNKANPLGASASGGTGGGSYPTAISASLYTAGAFWANNPLVVYSNCVQEGTAYFLPTNFTLCFGQDPQLKNFVLSQDPDVIYHEVGHALVNIMVNSRNKAAGSIVTERTDLGVAFYDEGGSINEGIADYFSYVLTLGKTHFSEWALGRFYGASRPISENDDLHLTGISREDDSRLSYPTYLTYDPNDPTTPYEDVHYAGQIASHFFVALTEEISHNCEIDFFSATKHVFYLLFETLSELGDLTAKGSNNQAGGTTHNQVNFTQTNILGEAVSLLWTEQINPMTFRRFFQTFAKFAIKIFDSATPPASCDSRNFDQDKIEKLLDKYGLLLFKTFNDNGNGIINGHSGTLTQVNVANRKQSLLIPKKHIKLNPDTNSSSAFVFDSQEGIKDMVTSLQTAGKIHSISPLIPSSLGYNNGNGRISPGEIAGIALNLYNDSNSPMAGIQVLANDWDHGKLVSGYLKPCRNFEDKFPLETEGAAPLVTGTPTTGDCEYITRTNGGDTNGSGGKEILTPVCFAQLRTENETLWVSQDKLRDENGLPLNKCLMGSESPHDCYIRAIPGAHTANYSKIDSKSTWGATLATDKGAPDFKSQNIMLFEINPWTPPGTTFDCRFRVRFTNCEDCWTDPLLNTSALTSQFNDDYLDYEYSGNRPFKIVHLQFTVID